MKLFFGLLFSGFLFLACNNTSTQAAAVSEIDSNAVYIPVRDLIQEEIHKVDSFAAGIQLRTNIDQQSEKHYINIDSFHIMAGLFLNPLPDRTTLQKQYRESTLFDEKTGELTLMYSPFEENNTVKVIIVYIEKGEFKDKVKRIYYQEEVQENQVSYIRKNTWKMDQYCMLSEEQTSEKGAASQHLFKMIWDTELFNVD